MPRAPGRLKTALITNNSSGSAEDPSCKKVDEPIEIRTSRIVRFWILGAEFIIGNDSMHHIESAKSEMKTTTYEATKL
ncbi:hypothetical protein TNCV_1993351 [Trichonephila clavipes]|nr:hypothetical protein TNCV_1993351 [Trichonephila clavipes]